MTAFTILLLSCGPEKLAPEQESFDSAEEEIDESIELPTTNVDSIRPFCFKQTYQSSYNGEITDEISYTWDGFTQEATDWYAEHNDYGYLTKSNSSFDGYISNVIISYDCDGWCKVQSTYYEDGTSPEDLQVTETQYYWEGNTQYQVGHGMSSESARYWKYNDMGFVIEYYDEGDGYYSQTNYEYSCSDTWCKLEKITTLLQREGEAPSETVLEYSWDGNRQNSDNGSTLYNDYGYVLEQSIIFGDAVTLQEHTYICDGE